MTSFTLMTSSESRKAKFQHQDYRSAQAAVEAACHVHDKSTQILLCGLALRTHRMLGMTASRKGGTLSGGGGGPAEGPAGQFKLVSQPFERE